MKRRQLGTQGLDVSAVGLGCMGMSAFYGETDEDESVAAIHRASELGVTFLDTAEMYGPHANEELLGRAIAGRRDDYEIATKFGVRRVDGEHVLDGSPANVRRSIEGSLQRLAPITSISTTSTAWTPARRSRRPSRRWASWSPRARSATWG